MGFRYIGSKSKILDTVLEKIEALVPHGSRVADLMSGTAAVSVELRKKGFKVISNDLMTYSYHHAVTGLKFEKVPNFEAAGAFLDRYYQSEGLDIFDPDPYDKILNALSNVEPIKGYFWKEFSLEGCPENTPIPRNYFSSENAMEIDGIRHAISSLRNEDSITSKEYSLIVHDLLMAANDVANIAGTYGHYLSKLTGRAEDTLRFSRTDLVLLPDSEQHIVYQGYAEKVASKIRCDVCYIDPPYMKRQYAANYHVLETIARGDKPDAIGVSGLRPWRDQHSNLCTKTKIRDSFREIISTMDCPQFVISYSEDGLLAMEDFEKLLSPLGKVKIDEFSHKRFKSNKSTLKPSLTEYLIHLEK